MSIRPAMFWTLCATAGFVFAASMAFADGDGLGIDDIGPTADMIVTTPSTDQLIKDGDESLVDTVMVYLDGCPLLSLTPGATKGAPPTIAMMDHSVGCVPADGAAPDVSPAALWASGVEVADSGLFVRMHRDVPVVTDPSALETVVPAAYRGPSLIIDISDMGRKPIFADSSAGIPAVSGPVAPFDIPVLLAGSPGAGLVPASAGRGDPLFSGGLPGGFGQGPGGGTGGSGNNPGQPGGGKRASSAGPGGPGGSGGNPGAPVPGPGGGWTPAGPGAPASGGSQVSAVPLPATLVLMGGALFALFRVVRRR